MNDLCADIGYKSINHYGEELCGDHVDIIEQSNDSTVIVLADGLEPDVFHKISVVPADNKGIMRWGAVLLNSSSDVAFELI